MRASDAVFVDRGGGVRTRYLVTRDAPTTFLSGITEFDPGASVPLHRHNCAESVVVLQGQGYFESSDGVCELSIGDVTFVPAGIDHRFANRGASRMRILWTYGSRDSTRTMSATGETFPIGSQADHQR